MPHVSATFACDAQLCPLLDKRVEIHGTSRADLNNKRGVATDLCPVDKMDQKTWRYTVVLDGGEAAFQLKMTNVRLVEGAGGGASGGGGKAKGKGKGKGKKGRGRK